MPAHREILPALFLLILTAVASASQPSLTPQAGVLVLRNGQVLRGEITRAGDYYVVMLGPNSEIRLKADEVEVACRNLDEAYVHRLQRLDPTAHNQRIVLAEWCLRNGLLTQAGEQLDLAAERVPDHPQIKSMRERLKFAQEPKREVTASKALASIATVGSEQLEKTLRELPDGSIEKFSAVIQPILLNRCGANQCHGPMSKSEYQLLKPALGQVANQRYSQRNLYSTLRFMDRNDPQKSPLVIMPQRRHGGAATPVFDERSRSQLDELSSWVAMTMVVSTPPLAPQKIDPGSTLLSSGHHPQTSGRFTAAGQTAVADEAKAATSPPAANSPANPTLQEVASPSSGQFVPRDAFDPEIFNRRFFSGK